MKRRLIAFSGGGGSFSGGAVTSPILLPNGTVGAPALSFSSDPTTGLFWSALGVMQLDSQGTTVAMTVGGGQFKICGVNGLSFSPNAATSQDVWISRVGSKNLAIGLPGTAPQDNFWNVYGNNDGFAQYGCNTELLTLSTVGTTTDTVANLLPAGAIILGVTARVTTTITTATSWALGDGSTAARFAAANSTLTAGTTSVGLDHWAGTVAMRQAAAAKLRVTTVGTPGAGAIRLSVNFISFTPPTS